MTQWSGNKVNASQVNDGNEYERKDKPTRQQLNAMFNNSLYASNIAENVANQLANLNPNEKIEFKGSNPNLLINGDFRVNQRGKTSYTGAIYTIDRWQGSTYLTVTPQANGGVVLSSNGGQGYFIQRIEDTDTLWGKTLTMSYSINGVVYSATATLPSSQPSQGASFIEGNWVNGMVRVRLYYYLSSKKLAFTFDINNNVTITIDYAKLEIGSVATAFSPRPYAEEIPMCMRYYQIRSNTYTIQAKAIDRPIPMRVDGTIGTTTIDGVAYNTVDAEIY